MHIHTHISSDTYTLILTHTHNTPTYTQTQYTHNTHNTPTHKCVCTHIWEKAMTPHSSTGDESGDAVNHVTLRWAPVSKRSPHFPSSAAPQDVPHDWVGGRKSFFLFFFLSPDVTLKKNPLALQSCHLELPRDLSSPACGRSLIKDEVNQSQTGLRERGKHLRTYFPWIQPLWKSAVSLRLFSYIS